MGALSTLETALPDAAHRLADAIVDAAVLDGAGTRAAWLGPTIERVDGEHQPVQRTGDVALYDGSAGIALACSAVAAPLARDDVADLAVRAARHAVAGHQRVDGPGLYDGVAGIGLAALAVGTRCGDTSLRSDGLALLRVVRDAEPERSDLISGAAGTTLAFLRAAELTADDEWLGAALATAHVLAGRAVRRPWGWAWPEDGAEQGLCGLAHGASGPAWVIAETIAAARSAGVDQTSTADLTAAVDGALHHERSWFDPARNNWPDLRSDDGTAPATPPFPAVWCHGAAGIGLARLAMHRLRPSPSLAAEAAAALQSTCAASIDELATGCLAQGLTVCHGAGGVVELLLEAHRVLGEREHLLTARWLAAQALGLLGDDAAEWPGGVRGLPGPGLMNGLAGTLCVLARADRPEAVPSVALLEV